MKFAYRTTGVCAQQVAFDLTDGIVKDVQFYGGCPGNQMGICRLVEGKNVDEVIASLKGVRCGGKPTSCPDQLACALEAAKEEIAKRT